MSAPLVFAIAAAALAWALTGTLVGVGLLGVMALWSGAMLTLLLAAYAWNAITSAPPWSSTTLAASALTSVVAFALFGLIKQATNHRPLGAATLAVLVGVMFVALLIIARRLRVNDTWGRGLALVAASGWLLAAGASWSWQHWLQVVVGVVLFVSCLLLQRRFAAGTVPTWMPWVLPGVVVLNLGWVVLGLPPSVQEATIVLGLLGVLS